MFDDKSLICQFDLEYFCGLTNHLIDFSETLFEFLNFKIKKIFVSSDGKVSAPSYKRFKSFINPDYFSSISFQSDYNKADFEPQTHLYININNFLNKGSEYVLPKPIAKFTVVINDTELLKNSEKIYKEILFELSKISGINVTGYSFLLPNTYGAVSFSSGVLRKMNMSQSLQELARWYWDSSMEKGVIGLYNCLDHASRKQIILLKDVFGKKNVETINGITFFKNESMNSFDIEDYFTYEEYNRLCDSLEPELCFLRTD